MSNTFKQHMVNTYSHNEMADMANHGATGGFHGLIWTQDIVNLYENHKEALHAIVADYNDCTGETGFPSYVSQFADDYEQFAGAMVYFAAEWVAHEVTQGEYVEESEEA
jgi:hypothetical protein